MQLIIFILVYPFIWFLSILPFRVLYTLSDILCFLLFYVFKYRKKVISKNLKLAFPDKSSQEISQLIKQHYCHFTDLMFETIKILSISEKSLNKRFIYKDIDVLNQLYAKNKSVLLVSGHYGNWEWLINMEKFIKHKGHAVYKPLKNNYFNTFIRNLRSKFGATPVDKNHIIKKFIKNQRQSILGIYLMVTDQSPKLINTRYWASFLGIKVPVFVGSEVLAKKLDAAVVFLKVNKIKRGYYEASFKLLDKKTEKQNEYTITNQFLEELEEQIRAKPAYYFWTHKRFKHAKVREVIY